MAVINSNEDFGFDGVVGWRVGDSEAVEVWGIGDGGIEGPGSFVGYGC